MYQGNQGKVMTCFMPYDIQKQLDEIKDRLTRLEKGQEYKSRKKRKPLHSLVVEI